MAGVALWFKMATLHFGRGSWLHTKVETRGGSGGGGGSISLHYASCKW